MRQLLECPTARAKRMVHQRQNRLGVQTMVLSSTGANDKHIKVIMGEYVHQGTHHNCPTFCKSQTVGAGDNVWLYFYDVAIDGGEPDDGGWWFGKSVGGDLVCAHSLKSGTKKMASSCMGMEGALGRRSPKRCRCEGCL